MVGCIGWPKFRGRNRSTANGGARYTTPPLQPPAQVLEPPPGSINRIESLPLSDQSLALQQFSYDDLAKATNNFSNTNYLGDGGFGLVYKGVFSPNEQVYAVKKLKNLPDAEGKSDFEAEIKAVSTVRHQNLVKLVGYCSQDADKLLVYEYLPKNSLNAHLHGKDKQRNDMPTLEWSTRMKIAIGSAKGLEYLHEVCKPKIIHRDIKAHNILLDDNFEPKVADFGLAKIFPESGSATHISVSWEGTKCYADPEQYPSENPSQKSSQKVSYKSDVYSFGVVLLELISGRKPGEYPQIVEWAKNIIPQALENGHYDNIADPKLNGNYDKSQMKQMICCAAASVRIPSHSRPPMSKIVKVLEGTDATTGIYMGPEVTTPLPNISETTE